MTSNIQDIDIAPMNEAIDQFKGLLEKKSDTPEEVVHTLHDSWFYLQVYAAWCNKLDGTRNGLLQRLGIDATQLSKYDFFDSMLEANQATNAAGLDFTQNIFPEIIKVGNSMQDFGDQNVDEDLGLWKSISETMETGDPQDVLELIIVLKDTAQENANAALEAAKKLGGFEAALQSIQGKFANIEQQIQSDDLTSSETIKKLLGSEDELGSIASLQKSYREAEADHRYDTTAAATSPTYAWIWPIGTVAAIVVASVHGKRAYDDMKEMEKDLAEIKNKQEELSTAFAAHSVHGLAKQSVEQSLVHTSAALTNLNTVQNAWSKISSCMDSTYSAVKRMIDANNEKLKCALVLQTFGKKVTESWKEILPAIHQLVDKPYVKLDDDEKSLNLLLSELEHNA